MRTKYREMKLNVVLQEYKSFVLGVQAFCTGSTSLLYWEYKPFVLRLCGLFLLMMVGINGVWGQTNITSLEDITSESEHYVITQDISGGSPGVSTFSGTLEAAIDPNTKMPYRIKSLGAPLFKTLTGTVKNIVLEGVSISSGDNDGNTGAIACTANGAARIYNVGILPTGVTRDTENNITGFTGSNIGGTGYTGGLVGLLDGMARVINCYSYANITGGSERAGIVGHNNYPSMTGNIHTMVMNCMFYGDITLGGTISPIYGGEEISNADDKRLNNYNYFLYEAPFSKGNIQNVNFSKYNRALAAEERYLVRFEFYRNLVNSTRELASWYVFGSIQSDAHTKMLKWVLDKSVAPYPIQKIQGTYPSAINYDPENTNDATGAKVSRSSVTERNQGKNLGTLSVTISMPDTQTGGQGKPAGATLTETSLTLQRTDKDTLNYNFNYDKVQLPYYNEVGSGNYTKNKVVTGWMITSITSVTDDPYTSANYTGDKYDSPNYNFADRKSSNKDLYSVSKRVFSQGAYFDVPDGVESITIEPYWGNAAYCSDEYYDCYSKNTYEMGNGVTDFGQRYANNTTATINGDDQLVFTSLLNAYNSFGSKLTGNTSIYDNAIVLVGNCHQKGSPKNEGKRFTVMSADLNFDNEPDYSLIITTGKQEKINPIRFDFINVPGVAMAHKKKETNYMGIFGNIKPKGWFETTNTTIVRFSQYEYDSENKNLNEPFIFLGGIIDMFTSTNGNEGSTTHTKYIHVGSNAYFQVFNNGCHMDKKTTTTPHRPISVTGGDYDKFYLSGYLQAAAPADESNGGKNAECYISGGRFGEVAGAGYEQIAGDVTWQIYDADMDSFYGGGINHNMPVQGNISTTIRDSHVTLFCGGPKFGNMSVDKTVNTTATGCTFGNYFGAGYGGTALTRINTYNHYQTLTYNWNGRSENEDIVPEFTSSTGENHRGKYDADKGIPINYDYRNFEGSNDKTVGYLFVNYASLSLAKTNNTTSTLTDCIINENFYGGGNLGKVAGDVESTLTGCTVKGNVFGAGFSAKVPTANVFPDGNDGLFQQIPIYNSTTGVFEKGVYPNAVEYTWSNDEGSNSNTLVDKDGKHYIHVDKSDIDLSDLGTVSGKVTLNINEGTTIGGITDGGNVYGGGEMSDARGDVEVNIMGGSITNDVFGGGFVADVAGNVTVNINGGTVKNDVYGGGALANININNVSEGYGTENETIASTATHTTTVNLVGGTVKNVYGGGLGEKAGFFGATSDVEAFVYGDVAVYLNGSNESGATNDCKVTGNIFGCNNLNGTPKGNVLVHVYKTVGYDETHKKSENKDKTTYDVAAVYGGGNLSAYQPTANGAKSNVIINGCDLTSIEYVYGGGNAAPSPETNVAINGCYEIGYLFGGGNGRDALPNGAPNPGADVGLVGGVEYGTGDANTTIYGGFIHEAYGASNQKGTIVGDINLLVKDGEGDEVCTLHVEKLVGAGRNADIDGDVNLVMGCMPETKTDLLFAGADNANVNGNVELTITSGDFGQVFCGNNLGGIIKGHLKVNIEETGCRPINIDELYLGGNEAAYSIYGYYDSGETDDELDRPIYLPRTAEMHAITDPTAEGYVAPIENPSNEDDKHPFPYDEPVLNVISCTSIGKVFGGGLGEGAAMHANPTVNINMIPGLYADNLPVDIDNPNKLGAVENVYGGGNRAAVYGNTTVNIGTKIGETIELVSSTETPTVLGAFISGTVYGAGKGVETNPEAAIVTGNTQVNMAGGHVSRSIYGGGELSSVGTFTEYYTETSGNDTDADYHVKGEPKTCKPGTGLTKVLISGGQVGLINQLMPDPDEDTSEDDYGYVFCAGKGMANPTNTNNDGVPYANLLAVSDSSYLEISGGLIAASAYGGSENGQVLRDTYVKITGGQIGSGHYKEGDTHHWDEPYSDAQWTEVINAIKSGVVADINTALAPFHECDAWPFGSDGERHVYDHFAEYESNGEFFYDATHTKPSYGGSKSGSDGHSYYGHVFGGGSGYYPWAAGKWRRTAGRVNGNTLVEITGGHILTNVYGGNEITDVLGHSKVVMKAGTVGVPRTVAGIQARPVNSYIFGAGMGDPRVLFNGWSNVASSEVIVDSVAVVFGSVFGGGEDGHVLGNSSTTIKGNALIGTFGTSGVDGNIFGSGRGFSALALTAGVICGDITVRIEENAKILGSVYGGGRLAAVGTYLVLENDTKYGKLIPEGQDPYGTGSTTHGNVTVTIKGGTIGTQAGVNSNHTYSVGDVFGGSKGTLMDDWAKSQKLGLVKNTTVNISQDDDNYPTLIYGNVYGGGEIASVGSFNYATTATEVSTHNSSHPSEPIAIGDVLSVDEANTGLATIAIEGGTIGQNSLADKNGSVFGGCLGKAGPTFSGYSFVNNSDVTLNGGTIYGCIFGGGENGHVFSDTDVKIKKGTVGIRLDNVDLSSTSTITDAEKDNMIYRGNVYGGGRGVDKTTGNEYSITAGKVGGNTNVTIEGDPETTIIYRNVYGGGSLASVGNRDEVADQSLVTPTHPFPYNTGLAKVTIKGGTIGTDGGAAANDYTTNIPKRENRKENGFVFGSGRGMSAGLSTTSQLVQLAYTKNTIVNIEDTGDPTKSLVTGSVFGGGENGHVRNNTKVFVKGGSIGTELTNDEHVIDDNGRGRLLYRGNVYGGGRGIDTAGDGEYYSLTAGRVFGDTYVEVSGGRIYHDVFGGGSLASVGNEIVNETTGEVSYSDESGETEVHIKGGIIGYSSTASKQGFNCGFVYGGCRGLSAASSSEIVKMAYVHDTKVYIEEGADIKGSVFGGGANGHVKNDTYVEISGGSVGTALTAEEATLDDHGVATHSIFRGNVYAGGRGVDQYYTSGSSTSEAKYSLSAGAVYGNAELKMTGGHVWHNIYGSGAMASVGTVVEKPTDTHVHDEVVDANGDLVNDVIYNPDESDINYLTGVFKEGTGQVTMLITGGIVGDTTEGHEGINNGNVFGAGRGVSASRSDYVASMEFVDNTDVTIGDPDSDTSPYIYGNVYGGGENGHVKTDTQVKIYSGIIGWPLVEGENQKYKEAADGSTKNPYRGHVFGGGCGVDPLYHGSTETRSSTAGRVYGHTNVTMTGGVVRRAIYGGGMLASVGMYRLLQSDMHITDMIEDPGHDDGGDATVTISGGYIGNVDANGNALGTGYLTPGDNNGFVFGSSCGMVADNYEEGGQQVDVQYRQMGYSHSTRVNISQANENVPTHIFGSVFGSGENGHVWQDAIINISGGQIGSEGNSSIYVGNVYGSGRGVDHPHEHISETAGKVRGNTTVNIAGGTIWRDVYGGGSLASVGEADEVAQSSFTPTDSNPFPYLTGLTRVTIDGTSAVHGSVYGSGRGVASTDPEFNQAAYVKNTLVTVKGSARVYQNVFGGGNAGHVRKNTDVTIDGSATVDGNVYGGGAGDISSPTAGLVNHDVKLTINGGLIKKDVYGGGAIANSNVHDKHNTDADDDCAEGTNRGNAKTEVNLLGGIILGDAYGGGQGVIPGSGATAAEIANAAALVQGDVTVTLNGTAFYLDTTQDDQGNTIPASGRVFGCNNLNGTPQGTVLVHVKKTKGVTRNGDTYTVNETKPDKDTDTYEVQAVYGGGNLAAYEPWDATATATGQFTKYKNKEGEIITRSVTQNPLQVVIDGCDDVSIDYVYGGGNAAPTSSTDVLILGAYEIGNVFGGGNGKDRYTLDGNTWNDNHGADVGIKADGTTEYGTGNAFAQLLGGTIHNVFGGSNTKGTIRNEATVNLDESTDCPLVLDEAYGGGNEAYMSGDTQIKLGCITYLKTLYGGARNANVGGDILMTITSGRFNRIFGGNNLGGTISGSITVNIEETGCHPIVIGELYGCGNQAAYETPNDKTEPTINVKSFTSIGRIFGGGLGANATVKGHPTVNVNEVLGVNSNGNVTDGTYAYDINETTGHFDTNGNFKGWTIDFKDDPNNPNTVTSSVTVPTHAKGKIGAIGTIFGGGNAAKVAGGTYVNIGTEATIKYTSDAEDADPRNVVGVDIRGDVFGGGNQAEVTGKTNVVIGQ